MTAWPLSLMVDVFDAHKLLPAMAKPSKDLDLRVA